MSRGDALEGRNPGGDGIGHGVQGAGGRGGRGFEVGWRKAVLLTMK